VAIFIHKLLPTPYQFKSYTKVHIIYTTRGYTVTVYVLEDMCEALDYEFHNPTKSSYILGLIFEDLNIL
jgi:hypothetical protein